MPFVYIYLALPYPINMSYCLRYFGSPCIKPKKNIGSDSKNKEEEELMTKIHGSMIL